MDGVNQNGCSAFVLLSTSSQSRPILQPHALPHLTLILVDF